MMVRGDCRLVSGIIDFQMSLDIEPEKGWKTESMYVPAGVHINAKYTGEKPDGQKTPGDQPFTYPMGIGGVLMNGCYGKNYQKGDPCYEFKRVSPICLVSIPLKCLYRQENFYGIGIYVVG